MPATVGAIAGGVIGSQMDGAPAVAAGALGGGVAGAYLREIIGGIGGILGAAGRRMDEAHDARHVQQFPYETVILTVDANVRGLQVDIDGGRYRTPATVHVMPGEYHGVGAPPTYGVGRTRRPFLRWSLDAGVANEPDINTAGTSIQVRIRPRSAAKVTARYV